jgi:hypothetical protein
MPRGISPFGYRRLRRLRCAKKANTHKIATKKKIPTPAPQHG